MSCVNDFIAGKSSLGLCRVSVRSEILLGHRRWTSPASSLGERRYECDALKHSSAAGDVQDPPPFSSVVIANHAQGVPRIQNAPTRT